MHTRQELVRALIISLASLSTSKSYHLHLMQTKALDTIAQNLELQTSLNDRSQLHPFTLQK